LAELDAELPVDCAEALEPSSCESALWAAEILPIIVEHSCN
jgi:hypothetical protein